MNGEKFGFIIWGDQRIPSKWCLCVQNILCQIAQFSNVSCAFKFIDTCFRLSPFVYSRSLSILPLHLWCKSTFHPILWYHIIPCMLSVSKPLKLWVSTSFATFLTRFNSLSQFLWRCLVIRYEQRKTARKTPGFKFRAVFSLMINM